MRKKFIDGETLWKAIRCDVTKKELNKILSYAYRYEEGDYYDYRLIINGVRFFMDGDISVGYFKNWLVFLSVCLEESIPEDGKIAVEYAALADLLEGFAYMDPRIGTRQKQKECREIIAAVKYANHKIVDLKQGKVTDFVTDGVVTYVSFAFSLNDGTVSVYRVCVMDQKSNKINYMYVKDIDYREDINYTFLYEEEFDGLSGKYADGCKLDLSMTAEYAAIKG